MPRGELSMWPSGETLQATLQALLRINSRFAFWSGEGADNKIWLTKIIDGHGETGICDVRIALVDQDFKFKLVTLSCSVMECTTLAIDFTRGIYRRAPLVSAKTGYVVFRCL